MPCCGSNLGPNNIGSKLKSSWNHCDDTKMRATLRARAKGNDKLNHDQLDQNNSIGHQYTSKKISAGPSLSLQLYPPFAV